MATGRAIPSAVRSELPRAVAILRQWGAREVYLFGSYATGASHPASDIDIATIGLPKNRFFAAYGQLLMELSKPFDLIGLDYDNPISRSVHEEAELVRVG